MRPILLAFVIALLTAVILGAKKESPCQVDIARIALQPKCLAYEYLEKAARAVHSPKFRWFTDKIQQVAEEFYGDNFVGIEVISAIGAGAASINSYGISEIITDLSFSYYYYDFMRTAGIGLETHFRSDWLKDYLITQLVWSPNGELYIIAISLPMTNFLELKLFYPAIVINNTFLKWKVQCKQTL